MSLSVARARSYAGAKVCRGRTPVRLQRLTRFAGAQPAKPTVYPGPEEDKAVAHEAFIHARDDAKAKPLRIKGLQEFCAAVWERRRRIPSQTYNDPLDHIFNEFDEDGDGHLTAVEVANALKSRDVDITPEQVQMFIDVIDTNGNKTVERHEFSGLIFQMAVSDLKQHKEEVAVLAE